MNVSDAWWIGIAGVAATFLSPWIHTLWQRWRVRKAVSLKVHPSRSTERGGRFRICVEVVNISNLPLSITCFGIIYHRGKQDVVYRGAVDELCDVLKPDHESLPYVLQPGGQVIFSSDLPIFEQRKIRCAFAKEASGRIAMGASPELIYMADELARLVSDERREARTEQVRREMRVSRGYQ